MRICERGWCVIRGVNHFKVGYLTHCRVGYLKHSRVSVIIKNLIIINAIIINKRYADRERSRHAVFD